MTELITDNSDCSIGLVEDGLYKPVIMWNLKIMSYISEKAHQYRAYGCNITVQARNGEKKIFKVWIKESEFHKFRATRGAIVDQTFGELIRNSQFDHNLWSELVPKIIEESSETIVHQRAAKNIGLQWDYLMSESRRTGDNLNIDFVEIVYKDVSK